MAIAYDFVGAANVSAVILGLVPKICCGGWFSPQNQPVASPEQPQLHHSRQILGTSPRMTAARVARPSQLPMPYAIALMQPR
jgi:hypothetical protein